MKKIISILLAVLTSFSCLVFSFAENEQEIKFAVASDLHFNKPSQELTIYDDTSSVFGYANRRAAMEDESGYIIDEFLYECAQNDEISFVLISGDMCDDGRTMPDDHAIIAQKLRDFEQKSGKPVYVTNGNHDTGAGENDFTNDDFKRVYFEFGFDEAIDTLEGTLSYTADLPGNYRLIVADSCDPTVSTEDGLTEKRVSWICKMAKKANEEGKYPILMMHHNFIDHMPIQRIISRNFIVRNHTLTAAGLANAGIRLAFTGHEHASDVASYTSLKGNKIYDFSTTSLTMYPLNYRVISLTGQEIKYESKTIEKIDFDALYSNTKGYTQEQISLMKEDLNSYAKGFLKQGIKYRLALSMSDEKLGIEQGQIFYKTVHTAVAGLLDTLQMPLYGEGSVSEKAKEFNIEIPQTDFENGWDLVTELMAYHYSGDEPYEAESNTVRALLRTAGYILLSDLSNVNDEVFLSAANKLLSANMVTDAVKLATSVFGPFTAGEYFIVALCYPIIYTFAKDIDSIPDNYGTIEGYEVNNQGENVKNKFENLFEKILFYIKKFFAVILRVN